MPLRGESNSIVTASFSFAVYPLCLWVKIPCLCTICSIKQSQVMSMREEFQRGAAEYWRWLIIVFIGLILWSVSCYLILTGKNTKAEMYRNASLEALDTEVGITLQTYGHFADYAFAQIIDRPIVTAVMGEALGADDEKRSVLRRQLYELLREDYGRICDSEFQQLHFHLPNGDSFLRFYSPETFGDNLFASRETIRIANTKLKPVQGFEAGRTFVGYRFVYPAKHYGVHVGSVEIALSMDSFIKILGTVFPERDMFFILERSVFDNMISSGRQTAMEPSLLSDHYLVEKTKNLTLKAFRGNTGGKDNVLRQIKEQASPRLSSGKSFNFVIRESGKDYLVQFLRIENYAGKNTGYLVDFRSDTTFEEISKSAKLDLMLVTALFLLLFSSTYIYAKAKVRLRAHSITDSLTGTLNRRRFAELAEREYLRAKRYVHPLSIIMVDIDHFKAVNDTYGHQCGDAVLKEIVARIEPSIRQQDIFSRWGGEEFLLLLPETDAESAVRVAEKIRKTVSKAPFQKTISVTVSLGVTCLKSDDQHFEKLIGRVDDALYRAKAQGRNQVCQID